MTLHSSGLWSRGGIISIEGVRVKPLNVAPFIIRYTCGNVMVI